eukprot:GHVS01072719.1.p1 GENE.GHVS01072719.1~~GHVS01072719.1.p1  ORF type:complete len:384 (+),score=37.23 GHVS01072719.1:110-1261(+)
MANLGIGKMKLLAAGPPLLFLALYSLSFIDLSFSAPPGEVKLSAELLGDFVIKTVGLKEADLIAAGNLLKNSATLHERLAEASMLYWSVRYPSNWERTLTQPSWLRVEEFKQGLIDYSLQAVKAILPSNLKKMASSVGYESGQIFVELSGNEEKMQLQSPSYICQCIVDQRKAYQAAIFNRDANAVVCLHSADRVLPFVRALGDNPVIISKPLENPQRDVAQIKVAEVADKNVCIYAGADDTVTLKRQGAVTISDGNDEEMMKYGILYSKSYSQDEFRTNEHFAEGCIWADLMKGRRDDIETIKEMTLRGDKINFSDNFTPLMYRPEGSKQWVQTFFTSSERTDGGSVKIGVTTKFYDLTTAEQKKAAAHKKSELDVLHYFTV